MADVTGTITATSSAATQGTPKVAGETVVKQAEAPPQKAPEVAAEAEKPTLDLVKPDGGKAPEKPASTPPAEIAYDLKLPDDSVLDPEGDVKAVAEFAKANKMTPELAKQVLGQREEAVRSYLDASSAKNKEVMAQWPEMLKADKEIGGDKLVENLEFSKRLLEKFGDSELVKALNESNLGNYPPFVRLTAKVGRALLAEDRIVTSNQVVAGEKELKDIMFPMSELQQSSGGQG